MEGNTVDFGRLVVKEGMWIFEPRNSPDGKALIIFEFWFHDKKIMKASIIKL